MAIHGVCPISPRLMWSRLMIPVPYVTPSPSPTLPAVSHPPPLIPIHSVWECVQTISVAYSLTTASLTQQNVWLNCSASVSPGTVLVIGKTTAPAGSVTYVTQVSDTCMSVAYGYGTTVALLQQYNPAINCSTLQLGANLVLPPVPSNKSPTVALPTCATTYAVTIGDTCASIAASLGLNISSLTV